ncbi:MAG: glycoside hydrolase family 2 TIM barrel-domain containing protein, partial [Verrucomicrobiota bacterium]
AFVSYSVESVGCSDIETRVKLIGEDGAPAAYGTGARGELAIADPRLWEPGDGYLYQFEARLLKDGELVDVYRLPVGIRTVEISEGEFLINGRPFYFRGFGKHEDSELRGRGSDPVIHIKDFNLMRWVGANSFRTSHYPYCEEILNLADEFGIVVIDESPAVGMWDKTDKVFSAKRINGEMQAHHLDVMKRLINRDKNHPSVVMWCVANEAATWEEPSRAYFETLVGAVRELDLSRPVTCAFHSNPNTCLVMALFDVICVNRYFGWYEDSGRLDLISYKLESALKAIHEKYGKPILMSEYGADAIAGFHSDPPEMFSEEYQTAVLKEYHEVFDRLDFLIGEHVWNFADFKTKQGVRRAMGNRKGIFTRQRQPKQAAFLLRERWKGQGLGEWTES